MHLQLDRFPRNDTNKDLHNTGKFRSISGYRTSLILNLSSLCFINFKCCLRQRLGLSGAESTPWDWVISPPLLKRDWIHPSKAKSAARGLHNLQFGLTAPLDFIVTVQMIGFC